jgi:hypothetical protein
MVVRQVKHKQAVCNHIEQCPWGELAVVAALVITAVRLWVVNEVPTCHMLTIQVF